MHLLKSLLLLIVPGALFAAALYVQVEIDVPRSWQPVMSFLPYLAVVFGAFLGWRFNRSRVLWTILLLVIVERGIALASPFTKEFLLVTAPLLVPVNLVMFCWWSERGLVTLHGLLRLTMLLAQGVVLAWLYMSRPKDIMALIEQPVFSADWLPTLPFPQLTSVVICLCMTALLIRFSKKAEALEGSFCWVLPATVAGFLLPQAFAFWGGVVALLLVVAIIESSFKMAFNDELTGLPARRAMNEFLLKVGRRYTLAMVDVDHFKKVNDTHGHDVGDQVLKMVATCLRRVTGGGRAYRYGGEEFAIIFPGKDLERAFPHLEELRETIAAASFTVRGKKRPKHKPENSTRKTSGKKKLHVTVSIGVATRNDKNTTSDQLLKAADQALYKAKKGGRNQVCCS